LRRWSLVVAAVVWLGLGVFLSWVNGLAEHGGHSGAAEGVQTEQAAH